MFFRQKKEGINKVLFGLCFILVFFVIGGIKPVFALAVGSPLDPDVPYGAGKWNKVYQVRWTNPTKAEADARACVNTMKNNGMDEIIKQEWGEYWQWGWAIACHESGGIHDRLESNAPNPDIKIGTCAFQITLANETERANFAAVYGLKPSEFLPAVWKNKVLCAKAGRQVLRWALGSHKTFEKAICSYAGSWHLDQAKLLGRCAMYDEFAIVRAWVLFAAGLGESPVTHGVEINPDKTFSLLDHSTHPGYGNNYMDVPGLGRVVQLNCHSPDMALGGKLANATKAFRNAMLLSVQDQFEKTIEAQAKKTMKDSGPRGKFASKYCIDLERTINAFLDQLRKFLTLSGLKEFILDMIKDIVLRILEKVCQYILEGIDAVLEMICLPIPSFSLAFGLPQIERKNCNGISMNDIISLKTTGATSIEDIMGRSTSGGLLPVNPAMTKVPTPPALIYDLISKVPISASIN